MGNGSKKILVIDDSSIALSLSRAVLEEAGYDVVTRDTPFGCGATALREHPDVILLDASMPALSGDELVRHLRTRQALRNTPIVLFSARAPEELQKLAQECGADGWVCKAPYMENLVSRLDEILTARARLEADADTMTASASTTTTRTMTSTRTTAATATTTTVTAMAGAAVRRPLPMRQMPLALFVDDDAMSLRALARIFRSINAEFFSSGRDALARLMTITSPRAIISDVVMPEVSGQELYEAAGRISRELQKRFVFVTGEGGKEEVNDFLAHAGAPVLYKPFEPRALQDIVDRLLR